MCNLPRVFANLCTSNASKFMAFVVFQDNYIWADLCVRDDSGRGNLASRLEPEQGCWPWVYKLLSLSSKIILYF